MNRRMNIEEIIDNLELYTVGRPKKDRLFMTVEELQNLIDEIKELKPCEGIINRQAVINTIHKTIYGFFDVVDDDSEEPINDKDKLLLSINKGISNAVKALPPAIQQPKIGYWIRVDKDKLRCSKCEIIHLIAQYPHGKIDWCPNCGTKMQEVEDEKL